MADTISKEMKNTYKENMNDYFGNCFSSINSHFVNLIATFTGENIKHLPLTAALVNRYLKDMELRVYPSMSIVKEKTEVCL